MTTSHERSPQTLNPPPHEGTSSALGARQQGCRSPEDKLISDLSEYFSHRRHRRGMYLPLLRVDGSE